MKFLDHLEEWLITFLMGAATLIIFVAVVHRYAASASIPGLQDWLLSLNFSWAQELTASSCSSGWPSSAPLTVCGQASTSASMC
jgi:TRAP-type C4-dicarboxylate transport system permease small subunit